MTINNYITDPSTKLKAEVIENGDQKGLVVATHPYKTYENALKFFFNDNYGVDMNINTAPVGTPELVHNGIDSVLWTASDIVAGDKTTFNSTDRAYDGTRSVKCDNTDDDGVYQFAKGGPLDCTLYSAITMFVNVDKDWKAGDIVSLYGWNTTTGLQVGVAVDLKTYFDYLGYDEWHKITIPLSDMGDLSGSTILDALRIRQVASEGKAPKYYLDNIQFEPASLTGVPTEYELKPDKGTWLHVQSMHVTIADAYTGTLADSSMPNIPYDSILGVPKLSSGIRYVKRVNGEIPTSFSIRQFLDLMSFGNATISGQGSDGTNTWVSISMEFTTPILLKSENEDRLSLTVNDDLSGLLHLRVSCSTKIEYRQKGKGMY